MNTVILSGCTKWWHLVESQLVANAVVNIWFSFIDFWCGYCWFSHMLSGGLSRLLWNPPWSLWARVPNEASTDHLTALLQLVCSFVVKSPLKTPCLLLQGSGYVLSVFPFLHLGGWGCWKAVRRHLIPFSTPSSLLPFNLSCFVETVLALQMPDELEGGWRSAQFVQKN